MRLIDADEVMRDAEHFGAFRNGLADLSDLAILLSGNPIDAEPVKHARWVVKNGRIVCDQCGALWSICPERKQQEEHLKCVYETEKFCYTCGAKMDLEG